MSWHCEDAALNYSQLPAVREKWHAIVERYREEYGIFDDWGMFAYTSGANRPWGDYLVEIDVGIWEQRLDERGWQAWVNCKREISEVTLRTAARSPPVTARPARATPTSSRRRWAAPGRSCSRSSGRWTRTTS